MVSISGFAAAAQAHCAFDCTGDTYYPRRWKTSHHPADSTVNWEIRSDFPQTAMRDRIRDGADKWSNLPQAMGLEYLGGNGSYFVRDCPNLTNPYNGIWWEYADGAGGTYATTYRCWHSGTSTMHDFQVVFDKDELWYSGIDVPPADRVDGLSLAVHEFGHALGFHGPYQTGHFDNNSTVCTTDPKETMCPFLQYSEYRWRSLEEHDKHTFDNAYD